jgi:hypothetical protein
MTPAEWLVSCPCAGEESKIEERPVESGGPPCPESQADGVPCDELDRDCEECERAQPGERGLERRKPERAD